MSSKVCIRIVLLSGVAIVFGSMFGAIWGDNSFWGRMVATGLTVTAIGGLLTWAHWELMER